MEKPSIGRMVHYVAFGTPGGEYEPAHWATIITEVVEGEPGTRSAGMTLVSLCVFNPTGLHFRSGVQYSAENLPGTWHWPERT